MSLNKYAILLAITPVTFAMDQLTKGWIRSHIEEGQRLEVIPRLFRLVHVQNKGAAWGILADSSIRIPFLISATLLALSVIVVYFSRVQKDQRLLAAGLATILGGALGNFYDRLVYGSVTDFLEFWMGYPSISRVLVRMFRSNRWPSFNIADVAIVVGLLLLMYEMFVLEPRRLREAAASSPPAPEGSPPSEAGAGKPMTEEDR